MRFTWRDYLLTSIVLCVVILTDFLIIHVSASLVKQLPVEYRGIVRILTFFVVFFILLGVVYAKILRMISPFRDIIFSSSDRSLRCLLWKQTVFTYEWTASILAYITPVLLRPLLYRMLGAKLGKGVLIAGKIVEPQMVTMGNYSFSGEMSLLAAHTIMMDKVVLKRIIVGNYVSIGSHAVIMPGVRIGDESIVAAGALVPMNMVIPSGEVWGGIPARKIKDVEKSDVRS